MGPNNKLILQRTFRSLTGQRKKLNEAREKFVAAGKSTLRGTITGDPNKRIRDHMKEVPQVNIE